MESRYLQWLTAWDQGAISSSQTLSWLDNLSLSSLVEDSLLAWNVLNTLTVNVIDLGDVVGHVQVVEVLIGHNSLGVQVVAVDLCDDGLVELRVVVVVSDDCLQVGIIGLDHSQLGWKLDLLGSVDAWSDWWWSVAQAVDWWQGWSNSNSAWGSGNRDWSSGDGDWGS